MAEGAIERIAVIGAGTLGAGIAQTVATAGIAVTMVDTDEAAVARGQRSVETSLARLVKRGTIDEDAATAVRERITSSVDFAAVATANLVIEAVFEDAHV